MDKSYDKLMTFSYDKNFDDYHIVTFAIAISKSP